jgi:hypothetical protein
MKHAFILLLSFSWQKLKNISVESKDNGLRNRLYHYGIVPDAKNSATKKKKRISSRTPLVEFKLRASVDS